MLTRPMLKPYYHVEVVGPSNVFLLTENNHWVLQGQIFQQLVPYLDGQHSLFEIISALQADNSAAAIIHGITHLEQGGHLTEGTAAHADELEWEAFWNSMRVDAATARQHLAEHPVVLRGLGDEALGPLRRALAEAGVTVSDSPKQVDSRLVVVVQDYLQPELEAINRAALEGGQPWMLVRLEGETAWVGPSFAPGEGPCWSCMADRIRTNRQLDRFIFRNTSHREPLLRPMISTPVSLRLASALAATEIAKWIVLGRQAPLQATLLTLDMVESTTAHHPVVRRPQCEACGDPERWRQPRPIVLASQPKRFTNDGGHRSVTPDETYEAYAHHISPITGIINWLVDITGDANGLAYSYSAGHNFALVQNNLSWLRQNLRSRTGGKGMTNIQAKVSAMGEAIERYSAVWQGDEFVVRGSYSELAPRALPMEPLLTFSEQQYAQRDHWNEVARERNSFHVVPNRFDPDQPIEWSPVWSLTTGEERLAPTNFVYFGHPDTSRYFFCMGNSSGCAAGNNREEAILQAFLELIERDACAIWWYNRLRRPEVAVDSFGLPYLSALRDYYHALSRTFWVLDITSDLGIPTFAAISRREDRPVEDILLGLGCHLDPRVALLRAITEMNQFLPGVTQSRPDGSTIYTFPDSEAIHWWQSATLASEPYLLPDRHQPTRRAADFATLSSDDLRDDVAQCAGRAAGAGLDSFAVELTRPDIGMTVCRVIVPHLRHFWRRLGPGRLYDVPVTMGWLDTPTPEAALNPYSIFF